MREIVAILNIKQPLGALMIVILPDIAELQQPLNC
jgi:hypothetical protein